MSLIGAYNSYQDSPDVWSAMQNYIGNNTQSGKDINSIYGSMMPAGTSQLIGQPLQTNQPMSNPAQMPTKTSVLQNYLQKQNQINSTSTGFAPTQSPKPQSDPSAGLVGSTGTADAKGQLTQGLIQSII